MSNMVDREKVLSGLECCVDPTDAQREVAPWEQ